MNVNEEFVVSSEKQTNKHEKDNRRTSIIFNIQMRKREKDKK
jgi:hypothetical protein